MKPILSAKQVLIPFSIYDVTNNKNILKPSSTIPEINYKPDFWNSISKLEWVDKDDNTPPRNPVFPSEKWTKPEWEFVQSEIPAFVNALQITMTANNFWQLNNIIEHDIQNRLCYHIITKGKHDYDMIQNDPVFASGFIGQDCGFVNFMKIWG